MLLLIYSVSFCNAVLYMTQVSLCVWNPFINVYDDFKAGLLDPKYDVLKQFPDSRHNFDPTAAITKIDALQAEMRRYEG